MSDHALPVLGASAGSACGNGVAEVEALPTEDAVALEIRRRRLAAGWSQGQLARQAGFDRQYIS